MSDQISLWSDIHHIWTENVQKMTVIIINFVTAIIAGYFPKMQIFLTGDHPV